MTINQIVTHPGGAHKDEVLACSVLLALYPVPIFRREPTEEDLADPRTCVVDVGHRHEPERSNFDHHQFPRDHRPTCALSLVLDFLGVYEDAVRFCDWLEPAEWLDCRGPVTTAEWLGVERDVLTRLNSPVDVTLLRRFARENTLRSGDVLWEWMRMIGEDLLDYLKTLRSRLEKIGEHAELWELQAKGDSFRVLFMPRTDPLPDEPSFGLGRFIESQGWADSTAGLIYPDRRGSGYGLSRFNDDPRLNFTRIEAQPDVHFAHKQGFVAKVSATGRDRLKALVARAWVG